MKRLLVVHLIFLMIALLIAFVFIPLERFYFGKVPPGWLESYYHDALTFGSYKAWSSVFTWFLGLSCGRLIFKAFTR